jgi:flagellar biosynthesis chaperone FliJ
MKTHRSIRQPRGTGRQREHPKPSREQAVRMCEEAAARIKSASDELAACWTTLGREISTGTSPTELLRRRAWCNVLELRLREKAHALEEARHCVDAVWEEVMRATRGRELFKRFQSRDAGESLFDKSWSLLLQPSSTAAPRASAVASGKH